MNEFRLEQSAKPKYFFELDLIKVVAIIWICLYHILDFRSDWMLGYLAGSGQLFRFFRDANNSIASLIKAIISLGSLGVNLFIIASGFGLTISRNHDKAKFFTFIKKRIFRVFPLYWGILLAVLFIDIIKHHQINYTDFAAHFLAINNFFPQFVLSISAPFWFIGTILQLYILFPFLYYISKKRAILLAVLAVILKIFIDPQIIRIFGGGRFATEFIIEFSLGIILGNMLLAKPHLFNSKKWLTLIFPLAGLIGARLFLGLYKTPGTIVPLSNQWTALLLFIILFSIAHFLNGKLILYIKKLSALSFIVFLTHYILITKIISKIKMPIPFWIEAILFVMASFFVAFCINYIINITKSFKNKTLK